MVSEHLNTHRLSAIVFTDIVGFTRKMEASEAVMMQLLKDHSRIVEKSVASHAGEVIKRVGDAFLISFSSALAAVNCAIEIQKEHLSYNSGKEESEKILVRIGVHLGDILIKDDDVFGDGVNIASRIQPMAYPGGISITKSVYDVIRNHLPTHFISVGSYKLKNVSEPLEIFHLVSRDLDIGENSVLKNLRDHKFKPVRERNRAKLWVWSVIIFVLLAFLSLGYNFKVIRSILPQSVSRIFSNEQTESRVAIIPPRNLTGDPSREYLAQGLAEELMFRLTQIDGIFVYPLQDVIRIVQENSSTREIRQALGIRYLVQGSIKEHPDSITVDMEIHDANLNERMFYKRYTVSKENINSLYSVISRDLTYPIVGSISGEEIAALTSYTLADPVVSDLFLKARFAQRNAVTWEDQQRVLSLYNSVLREDSSFALAHAWLSIAYSAIPGMWQNDSTWIEKALKSALSAVTLASELPEGYYALGLAHKKNLDYDQAKAAFKRAIRIRSDYQAPQQHLAEIYRLKGLNDQALTLLQQNLEDYEKYGDRRGQAVTMQQIGSVYAGISQYEKAYGYYQDALSILQDIKDELGIANLNIDLGKYYFEIGDNVKSLTTYRESVDTFREHRHRSGEAMVLGKMAEVYKTMNDIPQVLELTLDCLLISQEIGNVHEEAVCTQNVGKLHEKMGRIEEARRHYEAAFEIFKKIGNRKMMSETLNNIAHLDCLTGDYKTAETNAQKALKISLEIDDKNTTASILGNLGQIFLKQNYYAKSRDYYNRSNEILLNIGLGKNTIKNRIGIARTLYFQDNYSAACDSFKAIMDFFPDLNTSLPTVYYHTCNWYLLESDSLNYWKSELLSDSLNSLDFSERLEAIRIVGETLLRSGRKNDAKELLRHGLDLARQRNMKGDEAALESLLAEIQ